MNSIEGNLFVNIDETAVYFDTHHDHTINEKKAKTISVRHECSNNNSCTVCITVAADGTKLPFFYYFQRCCQKANCEQFVRYFASRDVWMRAGKMLDE